MNNDREEHVHLHVHFEKPIVVELQNGNTQDRPKWVDEILQQGVTIMATMQQVLDDLDTIKQQTGDYIASRDAIDVALKQQIADLMAQVAAGQKTIDEFQPQVDAAFAKAEDDKALLAVPKATSRR